MGPENNGKLKELLKYVNNNPVSCFVDYTLLKEQYGFGNEIDSFFQPSGALVELSSEGKDTLFGKDREENNPYIFS